MNLRFVTIMTYSKLCKINRNKEKLFTDKMLLTYIFTFDEVKVKKVTQKVLILPKADIKLQILKNRFR